MEGKPGGCALAQVTWPQELEAWRVPDEVCESAYNNIPARFRQALKTGLAALFQYFGPSPAQAASSWMRPEQGLGMARLNMAASWTLLLAGPGQDAPARLAGAAILPRLAGVPSVAAILSSPDPGLLLALNLAGIDDIFCPPAPFFQEEACAILRHMAAIRYGSLFFLHDGGLAHLTRLASALGLAALEESREPELAIWDKSCFDREVLAFCQGRAGERALLRHDPTSGNTCTRQPDAAYASQNFMPDAASPPLVILPGLEGLWLHPGANPDFFRRSCIVLGMTSIS